MDELERQIGELREGVAPEWDTERSARVYAGVGQLQRRLAVRRAAVFAGAGSLAVALAVFAWSGASEPVETLAIAPAPVVAPAPAPVPPAVREEVVSNRELRFADGSRAELLDADSKLTVERDEPGHIVLALEASAARFDVVPNDARTFEIDAGAWRVTVIGTRFVLAREEAALRVSVERGRVRVDGPGGTRMVGAGETVLLGAEPTPMPRARKHERSRSAAPALRPSWRSSIQSGDYEAAYLALQNGAHVDDDPWALMDAADAARLSGHPAGAVGYLERVTRKYARSPVAPLAAFTLGRLQLDRLGQPHAAAKSFAISLRLAPKGSLAQDALAREVEAWSKAGVTEQAYTRAQAYVNAYPDGRRIKAVRRYGGLE